MSNNPLIREPILIAEFVKAVLLCLAVFGVGITQAHVAAILLVVSTGLTLWARAQVTPSDANGIPR